jgi:hypothetical protein
LGYCVLQRHIERRAKRNHQKAKRQGDDQRFQRIEEHHEAIMSAIEAKPEMLKVERMRYGTGFTRLRHHDGGSPPSNTK